MTNSRWWTRIADRVFSFLGFWRSRPMSEYCARTYCTKWKFGPRFRRVFRAIPALTKLIYRVHETFPIQSDLRHCGIMSFPQPPERHGKSVRSLTKFQPHAQARLFHHRLPPSLFCFAHMSCRRSTVQISMNVGVVTRSCASRVCEICF